LQAIQNFFKEPVLVALRELALRQTAHEVETRHSREPSELGVSQDRILIHITADSSTAALIRRGRRVADYLQAECYAVCVDSAGDRQASQAIEKHLNLARNLHIETRVIPGKDTAAALVDFARAHHITQIFLARPQQHQRLPFGRSLAQKVVRLAEEMQVIVVGNRKRIL
jgi:two-component system sensor histidine kinase KdpD